MESSTRREARYGMPEADQVIYKAGPEAFGQMMSRLRDALDDIE